MNEEHAIQKLAKAVIVGHLDNYCKIVNKEGKGDQMGFDGWTKAEKEEAWTEDYHKMFRFWCDVLGASPEVVRMNINDVYAEIREKRPQSIKDLKLTII